MMLHTNYQGTRHCRFRQDDSICLSDIKVKQRANPEIDTITPASNLGYLAPPPPRTIFHGCQIVHWDPLDGKRRCPQKNFGLGYVKLHGFYANP